MAIRRGSIALCATFTSLACGPMPPMPGAQDPATASPSIETDPRPTPPHPESVWPGAKVQTLGEARLSFARYLNHVHSRVHPLFADGFLPSFDRLSVTGPLNDDLSTTVAYVIQGRTGSLDTAKVVLSSGVSDFDTAAVISLKRASPFAPADPDIWSSDGKVYAYWEFHRNEEACGTWNARPYKLTF